MSFQEGGCFVRWSEEEGGQKESLFATRVLIRERAYTSRTSYGDHLLLLLSRRLGPLKNSCRGCSPEHSAPSAHHLKRAGSDLLFTCLPRYGCAERVMGIGSTVPGRTAVCVIGRLRWTEKYSCRPRYTPREGVGSATRPSARRIAGPSPFLRQGVT